MSEKRATPASIDAYIAGFPTEIQTILQAIRETIRKAAPEAKEKISYQIPTFELQGNLVHFAAFQKHIGFYPPVRSDQQLLDELAAYAGEKGNLKFPLDQPIPYELITRIVKVRIQENADLAAAKKKKKK